MPKQILRLRSCVSSICKLERFILRASEKYGITSEKYPDILISLTEAVNNAIIHGNKEDTRKFVLIGIIKTSTTLVFKVTDEGNGFNPQTLPDPTTPENIACCGGRGVFLIKQLADDVNFQNNGSTVEICFKI